jgi:hypothetical protein
MPSFRRFRSVNVNLKTAMTFAPGGCNTFHTEVSAAARGESSDWRANKPVNRLAIEAGGTIKTISRMALRRMIAAAVGATGTMIMHGHIVRA